MTKARDLANIISGGFTADDIPNIDASKITTGTISNDRLNVTQFDDNKIVNDISTLALRQASNENKSAYNTNSMYVDVFQDDTGIGSLTTSSRHKDEYVASAVETADSPTTFSYTGSDQTYTPSGKSKMDVVMWGAAGGAGYRYNGGAGRVTNNTAGAGGFSSGTVNITGTPTYKIVVGQGGTAQDVQNNFTTSAYGGGGRGRVETHYGVGGGGGGYSGIFLTSVAHGNSIIIAGGGAGTGSPDNVGTMYNGNGGGANGQDGGQYGISQATHIGGGGTQSAGGTAGQGDYSPTAGSALLGGNGGHMAGGGGGGYYGGGGGDHSNNNGSSGSGGGSGYIGHSSVSNGVTTGSTDTAQAGTKNPPQTSHSLYSTGIARGNNGADGGNGLVIITPYSLVINATGNFISNAITASSSTNKMGAIITYEDNQGTNALNTDIIIQLSADNGSNFTTATLVALPNFSTGIKMAKVNDLAVTAGTSLKYKISFANQASGSKEARIRGVALQY